METDQTNDEASITEKPQDVKSSPGGTIAGWMAHYELGLLVVATPLLLFPGRWTLVGLAIILLAWVARWAATGHPTVHTGLEPPIAVLAVMTLVGLVVSADPVSSQAALWRIVLGLAWFYGLANLSPGAASLRRLSWLWIAVAAGLLLVAVTGTDWQSTRLLHLAIYDKIPQFSWNVQLRTLANPRGMGMALALVIPMLLALALLGRGKALRISAVLLSLLLLPLLALTQSLQGAIGLALAVALLLVIWRPWTLLATIPLLGVAVWAASRLDWPALALTALDIKNAAGIGVVLRLDIWSRALAMIRDMPLTGIGLDSYALVQTQFYPGHLLGPEIHAHNLLMQLTLEMGVGGLLGFLWLIAAFAAGVIKALRRDAEPGERALLAGAAVGVVAMLGAGLIDSLWTLKPVVGFWLLLGTGILAARAVAERSGSKTPLSFARRWHVVAGIIVAETLVVLAVHTGVWQTNIGLVQAHKALVAARTTATLDAGDAGRLRQARDQLVTAVQQTPGNAQVYDEIASLDAWLGEDTAALDALRQRVALDAADPLARYAPWEAWRRQLTGDGGHDPADDTLLVYSPWMVRYPDRAEAYVKVALVWDTLKNNRSQAEVVLRDGLDKGAQPASLLIATLASFEEANKP